MPSVIENAVKDWSQSNKEVSRLSIELESSKRRAAKYSQSLAEIVAPDDAKAGEVFHCWVRIGPQTERLIQVTVRPPSFPGKENVYNVSFRGNERGQE